METHANVALWANIPTKWWSRYLMFWGGLLAYALAVFSIRNGPFALLAQAIFFAIAFPLAIWPLFVERRLKRERMARRFGWPNHVLMEAFK